MKILVTGGAGYIGSHMVRTLCAAGHDVVVHDNLSTGHRDAVLSGRLVISDISDAVVLDELFSAENFDAVIHFAAYISVEESVRDPLRYYRNNFGNALTLIETCLKHGVRRFLFSSTGAVYGIPTQVPVREETALRPLNPYGTSKMMVEQARAAGGRQRGQEQTNHRADPGGQRSGEVWQSCVALPAGELAIPSRGC